MGVRSTPKCQARAEPKLHSPPQSLTDVDGAAELPAGRRAFSARTTCGCEEGAPRSSERPFLFAQPPLALGGAAYEQQHLQQGLAARAGRQRGSERERAPATPLLVPGRRR